MLDRAILAGGIHRLKYNQQSVFILRIKFALKVGHSFHVFGQLFLGFSLFVLIAALICPRWFRGFYRAGMTVSFHFGQVVGKVLLTVFFFLFLTPLGLLLRLMG